LLDTPGARRKNRARRGFADRASLEAAISLPDPSRTRAERSRATGLLAAAILLASPVRADLYRWKDAEGVAHYAEELERIPPEHRASAESVTPRTAKSRAPLPVLGDESPPGPDTASDGPRLGQREPAEPPSAVSAQPRSEMELAPPTPGTTPAPPGVPPAPHEEPVSPPPAAEPVPPAAPDIPADADPREIEIAELERELAARREELKALISQSSFDSSQISADPRLRELAEIVPQLQAELDALRGELGNP
jgi:hypothetical protein